MPATHFNYPQMMIVTCACVCVRLFISQGTIKVLKNYTGNKTN